ncbi:hypothetical protein U1Q18_039123 [Sarracenia purpurea var. burkii]
MAAAAVLAASDDQLTRKTMEIKMGVIPSWEFLDTLNAGNKDEKIKDTHVRGIVK